MSKCAHQRRCRRPCAHSLPQNPSIPACRCCLVATNVPQLSLGVCSACRAVVFTVHTHSATVLRQGVRRIRRSQAAYRLCCAYANEHYCGQTLQTPSDSCRTFLVTTLFTPPDPSRGATVQIYRPASPGRRPHCRVSRPYFAGRGAPEAVGDEDVGPLVAPVLEAHLAVVWTI